MISYSPLFASSSQTKVIFRKTSYHYYYHSQLLHLTSGFGDSHRVHPSTPSIVRILLSSAAFTRLATSFLTISNHEPLFTLVALAEPLLKLKNLISLHSSDSHRAHPSTPSIARILLSSAAFVKLARSVLTISNHKPLFTLVALTEPLSKLKNLTSLHSGDFHRVHSFAFLR